MHSELGRNRDTETCESLTELLSLRLVNLAFASVHYVGQLQNKSLIGGHHLETDAVLSKCTYHKSCKIYHFELKRIF